MDSARLSDVPPTLANLMDFRRAERKITNLDQVAAELTDIARRQGIVTRDGIPLTVSASGITRWRNSSRQHPIYLAALGIDAVWLPVLAEWLGIDYGDFCDLMLRPGALRDWEPGKDFAERKLTDVSWSDLAKMRHSDEVAEVRDDLEAFKTETREGFARVESGMGEILELLSELRRTTPAQQAKALAGRRTPAKAASSR